MSSKLTKKNRKWIILCSVVLIIVCILLYGLINAEMSVILINNHIEDQKISATVTAYDEECIYVDYINTTGMRNVSCGEDYVLYKRKGYKWVELKPKSIMSFNALAYCVDEGITLNIRFSDYCDSLPKGDYMVKKTFRINKSNEDIYARFSVK